MPELTAEEPARPHHRVAVIGAGFGGVGTVIRLRELGITDVVVFERAGDIGGTWRDNTYPGCQCDVPSHLYSFSFAPNPDWSRSFATQPEIQAYLRRVVHEFGVRPHVRFGHEVLGARWHAGDQRWILHTSGGDHTADVLVSAHGGLSQPATPAIAGLDTFAGTLFHSADWNHDHDLTGERVAVIGTGASAVQIVPSIQPRVGHLSVFQRTPAWVMPRFDVPIRRWRRRLYRRVPALQKLNRGLQYVGRETMVIQLVHRPRLGRGTARMSLRNLAKQVPDPDLRARLTPSFALGCKRILLSNEYYPSLTQANVDLVTEPIAEIGPKGITTVDGVEHDLDTIILATGFAVSPHPIAGVIRGRDGRSLAEAWEAGMRAHLGTTIPGFPNLFVLMGPNTALGHSSIIFMLEAQINYVSSCLAQMDRYGLGAVDVKEATARRFDEEMQRRLPGTVWNSGCSSWYLDANGRNTTMWPGFTFEYRRRARRFRLSEHNTAERRPATIPLRP
jgi:cation diffusion facilitator CzcD-associated flavoprotein CzcO